MIIKLELKDIDIEMDTDELTIPDLIYTVEKIKSVENRLYGIRCSIDGEIDSRRLSKDFTDLQPPTIDTPSLSSNSSLDHSSVSSLDHSSSNSSLDHSDHSAAERRKGAD